MNAESKITRLPKSINKLNKLEKLNLTGSSFNGIPSCIFQLKNLTQFTIRGIFSEDEKAKIIERYGNSIEIKDGKSSTTIKLGHYK